jgi:hypothetical protein
MGGKNHGMVLNTTAQVLDFRLQLNTSPVPVGSCILVIFGVLSMGSCFLFHALAIWQDLMPRSAAPTRTLSPGFPTERRQKAPKTARLK